MHRLLTMRRLTILFLLAFALAMAGVFAIQRFWVDPGTRCEMHGGWWDIENRVCATPISIAEITGRPNGVSRAQASMEKNRELIDIEHRLRRAEAARAADNARQTARLNAAEGR